MAESKETQKDEGTNTRSSVDSQAGQIKLEPAVDGENFQDDAKVVAGPDKLIETVKNDMAPKRIKKFPGETESISDEFGSEESPPKLLVNAMKTKERERGLRSQGSKLVEGLMNYLRILEDRIAKLDADGVRKTEAERGENNPRPANTTVELDVKFFNSMGCVEENGQYVTAHDGTPNGTYMCDHGTQHLIRVLYSQVHEDKSQPPDCPGSEPPLPNDIDILAFGVLSAPIATFCGKELDINLDSCNLVRFEKPFRPILRNINKFRVQLKKLENEYGREEDSVSDPQSDLYKQYETDEPGSRTDPDHDFKSFDRSTALPHFQIFVAFIEKYFNKQIQIFDRLRGGLEEQVAFENLWMLFDAKDTIYCPLREVTQGPYHNFEGKQHEMVQRHTAQAYRVVAVTEGMLSSKMRAQDSKLKDIGILPLRPPRPLPFVEQDEHVKFDPLAGIYRQTQAVPTSSRLKNSYSELLVYCFYVDFNGTEYGMVRDVFIFRPYEREMNIRALQAYPIRYATHDLLQNRGRTFLEMTRVSHMQYEGLTVGENREDINSPMVVDAKLAFEGDPDSRNKMIEVPKFSSPSHLWLFSSATEPYEIVGKPECLNQWCYNRECTKNVYVDSQKRVRDTIVADVKLVLERYENEKQQGIDGFERFKRLMADKDIARLLPGVVPGFALRSRRWVLLDLNLLKPVEHKSEWKNLVLPPGHREIVQAMVETHTQDIGSSKRGNKIGMDLIRGKGKGCIILLHGAPGVGKTSTAECVAAHTNKPLYPITCGDIGYRPEDVERNMESHFKLAHRWGCVLLLDEADVFLAKRDQRDVQRNGLVSVFLRILEYYSGILFLTTNRVGAIDDAFRSRLHLTLYYPKLTLAQTIKIFKHNFKRIAEVNADRKDSALPLFKYRESQHRILDWVSDNWNVLKLNGRQIRNAFQTVMALAEFHAQTTETDSKNPVITKKYFKIVAKASIQFDEYLKQTHGYDEDKVAKRDLIRAVEYTSNHEHSKVFEDSPGLLSDESDSSELDSTDESDTTQSKTGSNESDSEEDLRKRRKKPATKATRNSKKASGKGKGKKAKKSGSKNKEKKEKAESNSSE